MRILFYAPFKPLSHPRPSGDQMIARELVAHLRHQGHQVEIASDLRCRWIYHHPLSLFKALLEQQRICHRFRRQPPDLWLTYHTYYKAPDLLGPTVCRRLRIPYLIVQGSYATKQRRRLSTWPGYLLNRRALLAADQHIANRERDFHNLQRIIAPHRLARVAPGIHPEGFTRCEAAGQALRSAWQVGDRPVIATAAMFRNDVKSQGIAWVIDCCLTLHRQGLPLFLAIAGDGTQRPQLEELARRLPTDSYTFTGLLSRTALTRFYSAADLFVFPGFNESLGMVFLEAQSCALPVVAFHEGGIPEVVLDRQTGLLTPTGDRHAFVQAMRRLLTDPSLRATMGRTAAHHIRTHHDLNANYATMDRIIAQTVQRFNRPDPP
jgi:glycosyltransferase involved in cell wall biosynthesis